MRPESENELKEDSAQSVFGMSFLILNIVPVRAGSKGLGAFHGAVLGSKSWLLICRKGTLGELTADRPQPISGSPQTE